MDSRTRFRALVRRVVVVSAVAGFALAVPVARATTEAPRDRPAAQTATADAPRSGLEIRRAAADQARARPAPTLDQLLDRYNP